jgi:O-antigen/teichoic acid export membrane protein
MKDYWNKIKNVKGLMDLSSLGIANVGGGAISAVFWFYLASLMGPENYGQVSYLIAIAGIASVFCLFGSGYTIIVYTAKKQNFLPAVTLISLSSSLVAAIVLYMLFLEPSLGIYAIGYVIFNLAIADLLGRKLYKKYAKIFLMQKILLVAIAIPLYFLVGHTGVIYGYGLSMLVFGFEIYRSLRNQKLDFSIFKERIGFAINTYGESLARTFSGQTDKLLIAPLLGFTLLGNYHLGIQFLSLLTIVPSVVLQYTLPQDASGTPRTMLKKYTILLSVGFALVGILLIPLLIPIFFPKFADATIVIQIMSIAIVPRSVSTMLMSKFLGMEKSRFVITASGIFLAIQIPLIIVLGSLFSIIGVTAALVIAETAQAIFYIVANRTLLPHKPNQ